ncbi:aminoglycoside phosphotransferase family protein [Marinimicrobium sp. ARAG 43.8]|uniref:aminoglycoside phosphotransferase family protein n=1 Tax=Marinimicrobium sp. ARAG 43.8 TaxID=3418719 RepID=UPI003CF5A5FD
MTDLQSARQEQLEHWAQTRLAALCSHQATETLALTPLAGDAGFRRYYRLNTEPSLLAVDAPPPRENAGRFAELSQHLLNHHIAVPKVASVDPDNGFLLLEDLGDRLLYHALRQQPDSATALYGEALMQLLALQQTPRGELFPPFDQAFLRRELTIFKEWFLTEMLGLDLSEEEAASLTSLFERLEASALEQPQVAMHRDYHSRNLLIRPDGCMSIVDFQDAVWGPITYDLVSLLRDCYIRWPASQIQQWALGYGNMACGIGLLQDVTEEQFLQWFDWMGLQRHLKVLGIFSRLSLRDGKDQYLEHLPLVIRYILEVSSQYPELAEFRYWFEHTVMPAVQEKPWYQDYRQAGEIAA